MAAAEATRLVVEGEFGLPWWRWVLFLAAFAVIFVVAGSTLSEYAVQD
jgi:hypothetical protein